MWALVIDREKGHYQIDNIPFYAPSIACGDIVLAEYDEMEERITYRSLITPSGNSTIQVIVLDKTHSVEAIRNGFKENGCGSEGMGDGYFVMEIPAELDYSGIKIRLNELREKGVLDYAEACLSDTHQY